MSRVPFKKFFPRIFILLFFLINVVVLWFFQSCSSNDNRTSYSTIRVVKQQFSPVVTALGTVKPQVGAEVRLGSRIAGKVEHLYANIGDFVEKGQIIAELEKDELKANVEKQRAELDRALINLATHETLGPIEIEKAKADSSRFAAAYELEAIEYERQLTLYNDDLISKHGLDQTKEELLVAKAEFEVSTKTLELIKNQFEKDLKLLQAEVESAQALLKISEVELSYATLRAPISGIIASVSTQEGETVAVGLSAPTFVTIVDLDQLQVETYVDEVDIGKIKIGQNATFMVESFPSMDIEGEVVGIYPKAILRENVVFYNVLVKSLQPPPVILRPEMTANVSIFMESNDEVLVVPARAVMKSGSSSYVYLIQDNRPVQHEVQIGWKEGRFIEIIEGLHEGDEVIDDYTTYESEEL